MEIERGEGGRGIYLDAQMGPDFGPDGGEPVGYAAVQAGELAKVLGQLARSTRLAEQHTQTCTVSSSQ